MKSFLNKPHNIFWLTALYIFITGYVTYVRLGDSALDINIHDTYYVMAHSHTLFILILFYALLGFIYFILKLSKAPLIKALTKVHVFVCISAIFIDDIGKIILRQVYGDNILFNYYGYYQYLTLCLIALVVLAQILFIFNIIFSLIKSIQIKAQ